MFCSNFMPQTNNAALAVNVDTVAMGDSLVPHPYTLNFVEPPQMLGCPILRVFGEGWDVQIQLPLFTRHKNSLPRLTNLAEKSPPSEGTRSRVP